MIRLSFRVLCIIFIASSLNFDVIIITAGAIYFFFWAFKHAAVFSERIKASLRAKNRPRDLILVFSLKRDLRWIKLLVDLKTACLSKNISLSIREYSINNAIFLLVGKPIYSIFFVTGSIRAPENKY